MPFHFKKTEPIAKGVRRLCRERTDKALACLRHCDRPGAVHGVRKEIKKLRAVLRLVRGEIGRKAYRQNARAMRAAADCLRAMRDAWVMLRAFEQLAGGDAQRFVGIGKALRKHFRHTTRQFRKQNAGAQARRMMRKIGLGVRGLKFKADGWAAIGPGLRQSYDLGRKARQLAIREPVPGRFHEWRKHVKDLWYHFCLLSPAWHPEQHARIEDLDNLAEQLGDEHDLFLLQQFGAKSCQGLGGEVRALDQLIQTRQRRLRADALKLGLRLYSETPAAFCKRIKKPWLEWRGEGG